MLTNSVRLACFCQGDETELKLLNKGRMSTQSAWPTTII